MKCFADLLKAQFFIMVFLDITGELLCTGSCSAGHLHRKMLHQQKGKFIIQPPKFRFLIGTSLCQNPQHLPQQTTQRRIIVTDNMRRAAPDAVIFSTKTIPQLCIVQQKCHQQTIFRLNGTVLIRIQRKEIILFHLKRFIVRAHLNRLVQIPQKHKIGRLFFQRNFSTVYHQMEWSVCHK